MKRSTLAEIMRHALQARSALLSGPYAQACRILHGDSEGAPGLVIDRYGPCLIAQLHEGKLLASEDQVRAAITWLAAQLHIHTVYRKQFPRDRSFDRSALEAAHRDPQPWIGEPLPPEIAVPEGALRFLVHPYDGYSTGLFCEQRDNRARVRELSRGRRVLNLFAYTCSFSIAAAAGGAARTHSVDLSRRYLEWGKRNFAENAIAHDSHLFFASDVLDFFPRAVRQNRKYELIIVDPPTFARGREGKRTLSLPQDWPRLWAGVLQLLAQDGLVLACTNHRATRLRQIENAALSAAGKRKALVVDRPPLPSDFAGDADFAKSVWMQFA